MATRSLFTTRVHAARTFDHSLSHQTKLVGLFRGLTLIPATALNMVDMIGVGPFVTLPLMVMAMGGPKAIYGWLAGAILAMADGLVWAELARWLRSDHFSNEGFRDAGTTTWSVW